MKLQTLLESTRIGAALFFNCIYHYTEEFSEEDGTKPGDIIFTVVFSSQTESDDFIAKFRTKIMINFINDWIVTGSDSLFENIVDDSSSAEIFGVKSINKLDVGKLEFSHSRASTSKSIPAQSLSSKKWRYSFVFDTLEDFVHALSIMSGAAIVKKHFGSADGLLNTLTI